MSGIFIATPMYGGMCHGAYAASLFKTVPYFMGQGAVLHYGYSMNQSLVPKVRNELVADFMPTTSTHLMFIDSDIGFEPEDILKLAKAEKDIIAGLYPRKEINWDKVKAASPGSKIEERTGYFAANTLPGQPDLESHSSAEEPFEVLNAGTGFMLINRKVFQNLERGVPSWKENGKTFREYFATSIDPAGTFLSEDFHFCALARRAGFSVWVDPSVRLTHSGNYEFKGRLRD